MACYIILLGVALVIAAIVWDDRREPYNMPKPTPYKGPLYNRQGREITLDKVRRV